MLSLAEVAPALGCLLALGLAVALLYVSYEKREVLEEFHMGAMDAKTAGVSLTTLIRVELGLALAVVGLMLWLTSWVLSAVVLVWLVAVAKHRASGGLIGAGVLPTKAAAQRRHVFFAVDAVAYGLLILAVGAVCVSHTLDLFVTLFHTISQDLRSEHPKAAFWVTRLTALVARLSQGSTTSDREDL